MENLDLESLKAIVEEERQKKLSRGREWQKSRRANLTEEQKTQWREDRKKYTKVYHKKYASVRLSKRRDKREKRKMQLVELCGGKCAHCNGQFHHSVYDFHHKDVSTKDRDIARIIDHRPFEVVLNEVKKCVMLCANCHRVEHHKATTME